MRTTNPRSNRHLQLIALGTAALLALTAVPAAAAIPERDVDAPAETGSLLLAETFQGGFVAQSLVKPLGDACLTGASEVPAAGSDLGPCATSVGAPAPGVTPGYLQLTDQRKSVAGGVVVDRPLPAAAGVVVEFNQYQYGMDSSPGDGIGFFLTNGAQSLTRVGAIGGGLGYTQMNTPTTKTDGVPGGYLGLGLDAYGNFAFDIEGRGNGCSERSPYTARQTNTVTLRGPGQGQEGYCWLNTAELDGPLLHVNTDTPASARRSVRVTVSPDVLPLVTVEIDFTGTGNSYDEILRHQMDTPVPSTYKLGFSGSTGGAIGTHLVSDLRIHSVVDLGPINIVKQVRGLGQEVYREGDTVPYEFLVSNTDGEALTDVQVHDPLIGTDPVCTIESLAPAGHVSSSALCEGELTVTAADVAAGELRNVASVTAQSVSGPVQDGDEVTVPVVATGAVALDVTTTIADGGDGQADPGDTVTFTYQVANTGNAPLTEVGVLDTLVGAVTCLPDTIGPGETAICTADHVITEQDAETGQITGTATADATVPAGADPVVPVQHTHVTPVTASTPDLVLTGTATIEGAPEGDPAGVGDRIAYSFALENIGTTTLTAPHVIGLSGEPIGCEADVLEPGDSTTCVATDPHVVTEDDLVAGAVTVAARGIATTPLGATVAGPEQTLQTETIAAQASLGLVVEANRVIHADGPVGVGDQLRTSALVTSTGTVSVTGLAVEAALGSQVRCDADALAPGGSTQCVAVEPYVVTVEDVLAGELVVTKTATAHAPAGVAVVVPVTASVTVATGPERVEPDPGPGDPDDPSNPDGPGGPDTPGDGSGDGSSGNLAATGSPALALLGLALLVIGIGIAAVRAREQQPEH